MRIPLRGLLWHRCAIRCDCHCQSWGGCLRQRTKHCWCSPDPRGGSYHQAVGRHRLLSEPYLEVKQLSTSQAPTTWGHFLWKNSWPALDYYNTWQVCRCNNMSGRYSPVHHNCGCHIFPSFQPKRVAGMSLGLCPLVYGQGIDCGLQGKLWTSWALQAGIRQIWEWSDPTLPTTGLETFLGILEDFGISLTGGFGLLNVAFTRSLGDFSSVLCGLWGLVVTAGVGPEPLKWENYAQDWSTRERQNPREH